MAVLGVLERLEGWERGGTPALLLPTLQSGMGHPPRHIASQMEGGGGLGRGSAHPTSHVPLAFSSLLYPACSDSGLKRASVGATERRGPRSGQLALRSSLQGWPRSAVRGCW